MDFIEKIIDAHKDHVHFIAFSPDGKYLASCSDDNTIKVWNPETLELIKMVEQTQYPGKGIAFSPDGKLFASGSDNNSIKLWSAVTGELLFNIKGMFFTEKTYVWRVSFSPDSKFVASISDDNHIRIWDVENTIHVKTVKVSIDEKAWLVCFSPDGKKLLSQGPGFSVSEWNTTSWEIEREFFKHKDMVTSVSFSPDGKKIASSSADGTIVIWDYEQGIPERVIDNNGVGISHIDYSPNGLLIASAGMNGEIKLWNVITGKEMKCFTPFSDSAFTVAFSSSGKIISACSRDKRIWSCVIPDIFWDKASDIGYTSKMILVDGGTFDMGDTTGEGQPIELPVHKVTISSFYIGECTVSMKDFDTFCIETSRPLPPDSSWGRGNLPAIHVSWFEAIEYCNWLSEKEGYEKCYTIVGDNVKFDIEKNGYRLPTEAEWEFAAKGGKKSNNFKYSGSNNADEVAWIMTNSDNKTHEIGLKKPNELGIFDMSGNVWEWCWDWFKTDYYKKCPRLNPTGPMNGTSRVLRGGRWGCYPRRVRVSYRRGAEPNSNEFYFGFRLARTKINSVEI